MFKNINPKILVIRLHKLYEIQILQSWINRSTAMFVFRGGAEVAGLTYHIYNLQPRGEQCQCTLYLLYGIY